VLLSSATIAGAQAPLTLPEAQRRAVERLRQLVAQDFAVTASREMAVAAAQFPDPVATLGIGDTMEFRLSGGWLALSDRRTE